MNRAIKTAGLLAMVFGSAVGCTNSQNTGTKTTEREKEPLLVENGYRTATKNPYIPHVASPLHEDDKEYSMLGRVHWRALYKKSPYAPQSDKSEDEENWDLAIVFKAETREAYERAKTLGRLNGIEIEELVAQGEIEYEAFVTPELYKKLQEDKNAMQWLESIVKIDDIGEIKIKDIVGWPKPDFPNDGYWVPPEGIDLDLINEGNIEEWIQTQGGIDPNSIRPEKMGAVYRTLKILKPKNTQPTQSQTKEPN